MNGIDLRQLRDYAVQFHNAPANPQGYLNSLPVSYAEILLLDVGASRSAVSCAVQDGITGLTGDTCTAPQSYLDLSQCTPNTGNPVDCQPTTISGVTGNPSDAIIGAAVGDDPYVTAGYAGDPNGVIPPVGTSGARTSAAIALGKYCTTRAYHSQTEKRSLIFRTLLFRWNMDVAWCFTGNVQEEYAITTYANGVDFFYAYDGEGGATDLRLPAFAPTSILHARVGKYKSQGSFRAGPFTFGSFYTATARLTTINNGFYTTGPNSPG